MKVKEFLDLFKDMDPEDELKFDLRKAGEEYTRLYIYDSDYIDEDGNRYLTFMYDNWI